jgi:hypothetical protein
LLACVKMVMRTCCIDAAQLLNECTGAWRPAMAKVARLSRVSSHVLYGFSAYALRHPA